MSLESIRQDITLLDDVARLEFFQEYWKRRGLDMLKPATYVPDKKKKAKKASKPRIKKGKEITLAKLKKLPPEVLAALVKAGLKL